MSGFHVRASTDSDEDEIVAGFARACGREPEAVSAQVRWALASNAAGSSGVVAVDARSRVVAHLGVTHVPMIVKGARAVFGRFCASWVEPSFRTAGVHSAFSEIDDAFCEVALSAGVAGTFGVFSESDWWTLRRMHDFLPVRTELLLRRSPAPHAPGGGGAVARLEPGALDGWDGALEAGSCGALLDAATLGFRLGGPHATDEAWIARRDGRPAGVAIVRDVGGRRVVLTLVAADGDEESARGLLDRIVGDGSREVELGWFSRSPWFLLAQRMGFRAAATDLPYLAWRGSRGAPEAHWLLEHWRLSAGDVGRHPLPPMLADEEIVKSAPIGTLVGRERHA